MSRPAPRKKIPGSRSNRRKVLDQTKKKMKRLMKKKPFMTASEVKLAIPELADVSIPHASRILHGSRDIPLKFIPNT